MVPNCSVCMENRCYHQLEPLVTHDVPLRPCCKVVMDLFSLKSRSYLVLLDYFNNYPEVCLLSDTHIQLVITKIKATFTHFGIPKIVVNDDGP